MKKNKLPARAFPATMKILGLILILEIICQVFPNVRDGLEFAPLRGALGWLGILTYQFAHGGWGHLVGNLTFGLPFLAYLESKLGEKRTIEFYVACGVGSALLNLLIAGPMPCIGASGSLFGVMTGACLAFGAAREEHAIAVFYLFALLIPQLAVAPLGAMMGIAFYGHIGGSLTALLLSQRMYRSDR